MIVNPETLDGLVSWVSTFAGPMKADEVVEFHRRFESLPIVSLASPVGRGSMVSIDGDQGMHALISHLVDVHHYRKIALICGPEGHPYAKERHRVYLDALREKGLTPNPALITPNVAEKGPKPCRSWMAGLGRVTRLWWRRATF
jgi:DNA-binding LacI/PurR family transcriptional regulator